MSVLPARARPPRLLALVLPALLLLGACGGALSGTGDLDYVPGRGSVVEVAPAERGDPVELSGQSLEGEAVDVAASRGQVSVINVWWSGCAPCRAEMPMLVDVSEEQDDVAFLGINTRNPDRGTAMAFQREFDVTFPSIYDNTGAPLLAFGGRYAPQGMPSTVVLDEEGRVAALITGPIPSRLTLEQVIDGARVGAGAGSSADG